MAKLYLQYHIDRLITHAQIPSYPEQTIVVGGKTVETQFRSTVVGGFNIVTLVGMSVTEPKTGYGSSWDPVGTTYWRYTAITIPDGTDLPDKYEQGGGAGASGGGSSILALVFGSGDGVHSSQELKVDSGKLWTALGSASLDALSEIVKDGLTQAVKSLIGEQAKKLGLSAQWDALSRVQTVADALTQVHTNAGQVLETLLKGQLSSEQAAVLADTLYLNSYATLISATEDVIGAPAGASQLLKATGYAAEILRSATGAPGAGIKFNVFSGDAVQMEQQERTDEQMMGSVVIMDGAESSSLFGRFGNDVLVGGDGRDSLWGSWGNDALVGGTGTDTAHYLGARADYAIARTASGFTVTARSGGEGTDTLVGVERLGFSDGKLALDTSGAAGQAYRLYQAAFNRAPDAAGLGYQIQALDWSLSLAQVARNFINSPEFSSKYGALSDTAFVNQLYQNVLHRPADAAGLAYHVGNLAGGANTRANVLVGFSESPENQAALIGTIQGGMLYA